MLALQLQNPSFGHIMGLGANGQAAATAASQAAATAAAVTETVAQRVARLRARMIAVGIPAALGSGIFTTLVFAGAFSLARAERVWPPALLLGGVAALAGLLNVAVAAKTSEPPSTTAAAAPTAY